MTASPRSHRWRCQSRFDHASCTVHGLLGFLLFSSTRALPCGHSYCRQCLQQRCQLATRDRSMVPAQCCSREMPDELIREVLTESELGIYKRFLCERN